MINLRYALPAIGIVALAGAGEYVTAATQTAPAWSGNARSLGGTIAGEFRHILHALGLTADQQTQIKAIFSQETAQLQALRTSEMQNRQALAATAPTDPGYPALVATAKANAAAMIQAASDIKTQIYAVLTPAQQAQIPVIVAADKAARAAHQAHHQQQ